jgi:hypothetical protein
MIRPHTLFLPVQQPLSHVKDEIWFEQMSIFQGLPFFKKNDILYGAKCRYAVE